VEGAAAVSDRDEKILHGNQAKLDKKKKIKGAFETNSAVMPGEMEGKSSILSDVMAEEARDFVNENKK